MSIEDNKSNQFRFLSNPIPISISSSEPVRQSNVTNPFMILAASPLA